MAQASAEASEQQLLAVRAEQLEERQRAQENAATLQLSCDQRIRLGEAKLLKARDAGLRAVEIARQAEAKLAADFSLLEEMRTSLASTCDVVSQALTWGAPFKAGERDELMAIFSDL